MCFVCVLVQLKCIHNMSVVVKIAIIVVCGVCAWFVGDVVVIVARLCYDVCM